MEIGSGSRLSAVVWGSGLAPDISLLMDEAVAVQPVCMEIIVPQEIVQERNSPGRNLAGLGEAVNNFPRKHVPTKLQSFLTSQKDNCIH